MRIVIGVDWSDEAFAAVQHVLRIYRPTEVTLVHGIDLGIFDYPVLAQAASMQGYEEIRRSLTDAGQQALDRTAQMLSIAPDCVIKVNEIGDPSQLILDTARARHADLVVVGSRGRSRMAETILGSVSHRVLLHAQHSTLIVKGDAGPVQRVLVAVEGKDDGKRLSQWLLDHPFANPVELSLLSVVVPLKVADPYHVAGVESWSAAATTYAEDLVNTIGTSLRSAHYTVRTQVVSGEVAATVAAKAKDMDLVVVSSHGRHGVDRFLLGSVSQSVVHRVAGPILVVR